jgi:hypothetical protein
MKLLHRWHKKKAMEQVLEPIQRHNASAAISTSGVNRSARC